MNSSLTRRGLVATVAGLTLMATTAAVTNGATADYHEPPVAAATDTTEATDDSPPPTTIDPALLQGNVVAVAESEEFGLYLVDADGMSVYAFLNDTDGESNCTGECLENWPALTFEAEEFAEDNLAPILDPEIFAIVENPEAGTMVRAGDWPLYHFAGDQAPGDTNGQGVLEVWYLVRPDGSLIDGSIVRAVGSEEFGEYLVDADGMSLYAFLNDADGESTCAGDCAVNWPPLLVEGDIDVGQLDPDVFGVVEHPEGGEVLTAGGWPLYYFAGDQAPGDTNGQGVNDIWFLVSPDGSPIEGDSM